MLRCSWLEVDCPDELQVGHCFCVYLASCSLWCVIVV